MTRALIAARKSTKVEGGREGHSLHTQDQYAREFCERMDWEVIGAARDTISGRVAPIDRKDLGAWLAEPHRFDVVVAYRTDRLSRGTQEDWTRIEHWATEQGKTLVIVDGATGIRYPARDDSDYWQWQATKRQAGREWEEARERSTRSQAALVSTGAATGRPPYGYVLAGEKYAKRYDIDPKAAEIVREVFARVTAGQSTGAVAKWLTEVSGRKWTSNPVQRMINCWTYSGRVERNGEHYMDCPVIIPAGDLVRAQRAMRSRAKKPGGGRPTLTPALMVPVCGECGSKMYRAGRHYYCWGHHRFGVLCTLADRAVIARLADWDEDETLNVVIKGRDYENEIQALRRDRRQALERDDIDAVMTITERIKELEGREVEPDRVEQRSTGRTYGQKFAQMSREEVRAELAKGYKVEMWPDGRMRILHPAVYLDGE